MQKRRNSSDLAMEVFFSIKPLIYRIQIHLQFKYINSLVQNCSNTSGLATQLLQFCDNL